MQFGYNSYNWSFKYWRCIEQLQLEHIWKVGRETSENMWCTVLIFKHNLFRFSMVALEVIFSYSSVVEKLAMPQFDSLACCAWLACCSYYLALTSHILCSFFLLQQYSKQLEETMENFSVGKVKILICTNIVESGLDIQNANTIIIQDVQQFGLAQLYQAC